MDMNLQLEPLMLLLLMLILVVIPELVGDAVLMVDGRGATDVVDDAAVVDATVLSLSSTKYGE